MRPAPQAIATGRAREHPRASSSPPHPTVGTAVCGVLFDRNREGTLERPSGRPWRAAGAPPKLRAATPTMACTWPRMRALFCPTCLALRLPAAATTRQAAYRDQNVQLKQESDVIARRWARRAEPSVVCWTSVSLKSWQPHARTYSALRTHLSLPVSPSSLAPGNRTVLRMRRSAPRRR